MEHTTFRTLTGVLGTLVLSAASSAQEATPADVYSVLVQVRSQVELLREGAGVSGNWPRVSAALDVKPHHVLQKSFEALGKVNRLRAIRGLGPITIPAFPAREITPNEVLSSCERLLGELRILSTGRVSSWSELEEGRTIIAQDNYELLASASLGLDAVLGVRGFTPDDVLQQSLIVLENARFLRLSQNLPLDVPEPDRVHGKHSNHALAEARDLLAVISRAEENLWIPACAIPEIPRRRIEPAEVYDMLQIVLAEQQRIKFRLGLDRHFPTPPLESGRTPDDVIRNLKWAHATMPTFEVARELIQYDPASLKRTPRDVWTVARRVERKLQTFRAFRGIRAQPRPVLRQLGAQPRHVLTKTIECLKKVDHLRIQVGLGETATPRLPLRPITPTEVYALAVRLEAEIDLLLEWNGVSFTTQGDPDWRGELEPAPTDALEAMSRVANWIDTIIGSDGYEPPDVLRQAKQLTAELQALVEHLGQPVSSYPELVLGKAPTDVVLETHDLLRDVQKIQRRAGMYTPTLTPHLQVNTVTPNTVFNEVMMVCAEVNSLKVHLGVDWMMDLPDRDDSATPSHVFREMRFARMLLGALSPVARPGSTGSALR